MEIIKQEKISVDEIVSALKNGAVLVLPTDTVYGLVCDATNNEAVEKIFRIKQRDKSKTLPIFVEDVRMAKEHAVISGGQEEFLKKNWPGAVTVVLERKDGLSALVYMDNTIAMRQPKYNLIIDIIKSLGKPLAQTSANISDRMSLTQIREVINTFSETADKPDLIVDAGDLPKNEPSAIIDLTKEEIKILRK